MNPLWRKYLDVRAPRYTSYPSALHFDEQATAADYGKRLGEVGLYEPLSLYVHIPFCRQMCWYCGCNMRVENDYGRALRYVRALNNEIGTVGRRLGGAGRPLSVHFGGGTPNFLKVAEIGDILGAIELALGLTDGTRLAIELDPRLIGDGDVERLAALGFNRMSLGVQDFDPGVQAAINRIQSFEMIESAVGDMRRVGVNDVSFDLLYGLPKQTAESFEATLEKTIALSPDRVAVFGYAHLPSQLPRQRLLDETLLPPEETRADLAGLADDMLVAAGYRRVGFDHYAKPDNPLARAELEGRLRRNFQGFTDDLADTTIGFGASAIGFVGGLYAQNAKTLGDYYRCTDRGELATARGLVLSPREVTIGQTIRGLLCRSQADIASLLAALSPTEANAVCARLESLEADGVISWDGDRIALRPEARPLSRVVAMALDPYAPVIKDGAARTLARAL
ncbi:MAG: oxygen-independent coproporphyrinogen III oxidase [Alphaproteobacteria bacterium RIFCSPHIGHO2_12_FULL_63_12]|nr:MAG: oxygen-independent coproporphyrinogen III oxidase [Alphaproteobacteria bacterium RIFCSPHIGHO2_12_FULL_63_12]